MIERKVLQVVRLSAEEKARLIELARQLERDQSDTLRMLIRRGDARQLAQPLAEPVGGEAVRA